jgi:hypothetical protein
MKIIKTNFKQTGFLSNNAVLNTVPSYSWFGAFTCSSFIKCLGSGSTRIRNDFALLRQDPDAYWECGFESGSSTNEIREDKSTSNPNPNYNNRR